MQSKLLTCSVKSCYLDTYSIGAAVAQEVERSSTNQKIGSSSPHVDQAGSSGPLKLGQHGSNLELHSIKRPPGGDRFDVKRTSISIQVNGEFTNFSLDF